MKNLFQFYNHLPKLSKASFFLHGQQGFTDEREKMRITHAIKVYQRNFSCRVICSKLLLLLIVCSIASCTRDMPEDVSDAYDQLPEHIDFNYHVRPILSDRCYACHGPDPKTRKASLRLDLEEEAFEQLISGHGQALIPRQAFDSEVVKRILSTDPEVQMPTPESKLTLSAKEKAVLIKWLEQGAEWKTHWSFIAPKKTELPKVSTEDQVYNEIDRFILHELENKGYSFSEKANKETLIRRLYLDLIGMPPTIEAVDQYLNDESPNAYSKVVDDLLASSHYGERWTWDWLDAARYADTNGFQADPTRKMWPWRDWVIKAINDNMPYDQFTIEQLAGDLIPNATDDQILATAFNRNHMYNGEGGRIAEETRVENVYDRLETTGTVFMGLTFNCTRCHDHKFDPISQKEYFQFYDYFNQTSETGLNGNGMIPPVLIVNSPLEKEKVEELHAYVKQLGEKISAQETEIYTSDTGIHADSPEAEGLDARSLYQLEFNPAKRHPYYVGLIRDFFKEKNAEYADLLDELKTAMEKRIKEADKTLQVMVMDEVEHRRPTYILDKGAYDKPLDKVDRGVPQILPALPEDGKNNRLTLAKWLVSEEHPLTSRVTVNRFWQAFFGQGIVKTTGDFGIQGALPTHPELLDWLAVDFMENGWDVKSLIKQIVHSRTYQQSSKLTPALLENDPENKLLSRSPRYRLPSWMIRDQALSISGLMIDSLGGPSVKPYQPEGIWAEATFGQIKYQQDHGEALYRRTLYTFWRRIIGPTMVFDNASRQLCTVKPILTNSPQHALITLNDITFLEAARVMAARVLLESQTTEERIQQAFRMATLRFPKPKEHQVMHQQLEHFKQEFENNPASINDYLSVGEFPLNQELDKLELAAFAVLCSTILNLDETLTKQ